MGSMRAGKDLLGRAARLASIALAIGLIPASVAQQADDDELVAIGTPNAILTAPIAGAPYTAPASITLAATATVRSGTVSKVAFYRDNVLIHADASAPYGHTWTAVPAGVYRLQARATSSYGMTGHSLPVEVRVCGIPTVSITAPAAGATLATGQVTQLTAAAASPNDGCTIGKVEFYAKLGAAAPALVGTALGVPPYQVDWTPASSGAYTLTAKVFDQRNVTATSAAVAVNVNAAPTVSISAPAASQVFAPNATIAITAVPADTDGTISKVEFYQGATLLGTRTAAPWTHSWAGVPKGNYTLTAKAFDNLNAATTSAAVAIAVTAPPTVSITSPAANAVFTPPANITINASASDPDGSIAKVEFFQGASLLCTDTAAPFTCAWNGVAGGAYSVTAKATDNQGATATSAVVPIVVNQSPVVSLASPAAGAAFAAPATIGLAASASDPDGTIAEVRFYNGATLLNTDTTSPYAFTWSAVAAGTYAVSATAVDNRGATKASATVNVTICGPPAVTITSPNGGAYAAPATIGLSANASSACGIQKVEFYDGATLIATDTASPFAQTWSNVTAPGAHVVKARAYDGVGQVAESQTTIQIVNNGAPVINSVSPTTAQVVTGSSANFLVSVTDADSGNALTVSLWNGATQLVSIGPVGSGTHTLSWVAPVAGTYNLTVKVSDPYTTVSQAVTLVATSPPTSAPPNPDAVIPASYPTPPIGTLAGTFGVSESGAATYSIPLKVAPGTAGMEPALSLNYSSQGSYGQLGVGFSLGGLSVITRCRMTVAQDGITQSINYDNSITNDRWCLDGQRLVPVFPRVDGVSDPYADYVPEKGTSRQEWRTELETYAKIESYMSTTPELIGAPFHWRVTTKAGQIMDYGSRWWVVSNGAGQQSGSPGIDRGTDTKLYVLDRVTDRAGNYMEIDYIDRDILANPTDDSTWSTLFRMHYPCAPAARASPILPRPFGAFPEVEYWVSKIRYYAKGTSCSDPHGAVVFEFEDIPGQTPGPGTITRDRYYDSGAGQSAISVRLKAVRMLADTTNDVNGALARRYQIAYRASQQSGRQLVASVQECGADNVCLPATTFNWAEEAWNATGKRFAATDLPADVLPFSLPPSQQQIVWAADWNGDGRSDLIGWQRTDLGNNSYQFDLRVCVTTPAPQYFDCGPSIIQEGVIGGSPMPAGRVNVMDIDNDGRADVIYRPDTFAEWQFWRSTGANTAQRIAGSFRSAFAGNGVPLYQGDFNGDGRIDIITWKDDQRFETCLTDNDTLRCSEQDLQIPSATCKNNPADCEDFKSSLAKFEILVADVDGDGRADLVRRRDKYQDASGFGEFRDEWKVCFARFNGTTGDWQCHARFVKGPPGKIDQTFVLDFNGDGLADTIDVESPVSTKVCLSTGDGAFEFHDWYVHWSRAKNSWVDHSEAPIDFYTAQRCRDWVGNGVAGGADKVMQGDFNADGRSDLLVWNGGANRWRVCLSTGTNFACSDWPGPALAASNPDLFQQIVAGDFDGDGKTDFIYLPDAAPIKRLALAQGPGSGDVIKKITTGLGAVTEITHKPLTDPGVYLKGSGASPALRELDIQSPMYVVQQVAASTGHGAERFTTSYFYEGLRGRTTGRGLYGFAKVRSRDGVGLVTETLFWRLEGAETYELDWPLVGRPKEVRKYAPAIAGYLAPIQDATSFNGASSLFGGSLRLVNRSTSSWVARRSQTCRGAVCVSPVDAPPHPFVYEVNLTGSVDKTFELDGSALASVTTTMGTIDAYGNPGSVGVESLDGYGKTTVNTYAPADTANWIVDRLLSAEVTTVKPGSPNGVRKSGFTYQGVAGGSCAAAPLGYLCSEVIEPDKANDAATSYSLWQRTSYTYDAFGNRTSASLAFKQRDGTQVTRTTSTGYDSRGRFAVSKTYPSLPWGTLSESSTFDARFGIATTQTDPNGLSVTKLLDGFGRVYGQRSFNASGVKVAETFSAVEASGLQAGEKYRQRQVASGGTTLSTYFDELQREVRREAKQFAAGYVNSSVSYDAAGRKSAATKPAGAGTVTTAWAYDTLNRLASETMTGSGLSLTSTYAYGVTASMLVDGASVGPLKSVSITQSGTGITPRTNVKYSNSQGQAVRVVDGEGGATSFVYDAYGNLAKAIGPTGIAEQMTYDQRGRKVSLANPDSGAWSYEYNGAGELVRQVDAKAQVTRNFYDALGRAVERREHPGNESTTPFVTVTSFDLYADGSICPHGKGKACEVRTATVTRASIGGALPSPQTRQQAVFDDAGRAVQGTTTIDGRAFVTTTTFDANGRVDKLQYPSGYTVVSRYTAWSGSLDRVAEWTGAAVGQVHWLATARYPDGQLSTATAGVANLSRSYDGFGRVSAIAAGVGANPTSLQSATYAFDALGNLTQRSEAVLNPGTQNYGYDRVDRLTSDAGAGVSYDAAGNITLRAGASYAYQAGTHRMLSHAGTSYGYDANGNVVSIGGGTARTITPTAFNLPATIAQGATTLAYVYDAGHKRVKETATTAAGTTTTYYFGGYEELTRTDGVAERRHWIATPDGTAGIHTTRTDGSTASRYWLTDHLGSVAGVVDEAGAVKQKATYAAWGGKTQVTQSDPQAEDRGFTGHE
ncbi:MAG: VCBS repeat-containing protein, partial [Burkholderiales bacterium]|nr:VCBS repeat-containing protein [Burkholderiales bacterium]